ncbi:antibiotic biosynthesis monooxygenase [Deinococcus sp. HMF7604]|uniref:antibiotic biosynthesis monooxygenase family protein n=1 Tax=Deinococcus betulae TaxID=2873312 RepID=UPI001CC9A571|nr:antibiotic biosynthesis monooxygenase [Deinococcus betulae]MBZ9752286.1 antibiotic biosynthesis monooxygenase [Deinococcus betulae]
MIHIWATVHVEDVQHFIGVFSTIGAHVRRQHGGQRSWLFTVPEQANQLRVLFEWESRESFDAFLADTEVRATMQSSGTIGRPDFLFLEALADLPA